MNKTITFFFLMLLSAAALSQQMKTDSLLNVIRNSKDINHRLETARYYTSHYTTTAADSLVYCGQQLLKIGEAKGYPDMISYGKSFMGSSYAVKGQMYKGLQLNIEALKLAEQLSNNLLFAYISHMYGLIYMSSNPEKGKEYYKRTLVYLEGDSRPAANLMKRTTLVNLAARITDEKQYDSALFYLRKAEELCHILKDTSSNVYAAIGRVYLGLKQPSLAYAYYQLNLDLQKRLNQRVGAAYVGMARYYTYISAPDSALASLAVAYPGKRFDSLPPNQLLDPALLYYQIYKLKGNDKEALRYLEKHRTAQAQFDSVAQIQQMQSLSFEEDQRQLFVAQQKLQAEQERKNNLQYAAMALVLVSFVIVFFLFSHSIIANQKVIRFFGVIALLIVFEFLNLLLHPWLGSITHHSPILMLFAMVCVAALLIPLHHKMEHWVTHKLVEKNKRIRLAAAKKTIAKLEAEQN